MYSRTRHKLGRFLNTTFIIERPGLQNLNYWSVLASWNLLIYNIIPTLLNNSNKCNMFENVR